jgi:predicted O-linked N-acetylglucosamine transferase (SPINDLY family)
MIDDELLEAAKSHHQAGRLGQAEAAYRQVLARTPNQPEALQLLGVLALQVGKGELAVQPMQRAIAIQPAIASYHSNLGLALTSLNRLPEAIATLKQATSLDPRDFGAQSNLANTYLEMGNFEEAAATARVALALSPNHFEAHYNLGNALRGLGRIDEAMESYRQAIRLSPNDARAHNNLAIALVLKKEYSDGLTAFDRALELQPGMADAHLNRGNALRLLGRVADAIAAYESSIRLSPDQPSVHHQLGKSYAARGMYDQAIQAYRNAIQQRPDFADAWNDLGQILQDQGEPAQAMSCFREAIKSDPSKAAYAGNIPYAALFNAEMDPREVLNLHREWARRYADPLTPPSFDFPNVIGADRRLRIGYISPDFANHSIARFLLPLLQQHDHDAFEIFAYSDVETGDATTETIRGQVQAWRDIVGLSDEAVAEQIRKDRIDVLVDLSLHTHRNRLLAFVRKPAPVQVAWLSYPGTSGMAAMDYRLTDPFLDPPGENDGYYSERSIRLPQTFWCYHPYAETPTDLPSGHSDRQTFTFGCLNTFAKISPSCLATWRQLLLEMPNSQLLLHAQEGSHRQGVHDFFAAGGVDRSRLRFIGRLPLGEYLAAYQQIDVCLDPFPYNGGTTTFDALWMGVPVITMQGKIGVHRSGLSILSNLGLKEWVATSTDEYTQIARCLAEDREHLEELRRGMRERMKASPLMDANRFARNMESAYREMWRRWCESADVGRAG